MSKSDQPSGNGTTMESTGHSTLRPNEATTVPICELASGKRVNGGPS